jgi:hypothetical protein
MTSAATARQPPPSGDGIDVTESFTGLPHVGLELAVDVARRSLQGKLKYGTVLCTHNGRDAVVDAYQEVLDLCVYLHQAVLEQPPPTKEWDPYSKAELLRQLRDDSIRMAETMRRRLLSPRTFVAHGGSPTLRDDE